MECDIEQNTQGCPCTYPGCSRKGKCCKCIRHHLASDQLPACCFPPDVEATYDRSFRKFVEINSGCTGSG